MDKFTSKHYAFLILATGIVSMKTYPRVFLKEGGRESWIAVIIASMLILGFYVYLLSICKKYNCFSFKKIYEKALGPTVGKIFIMLFMATLFITLLESAAAESNSMHTNMLLETPHWYLLIFFIFPIIYTIRKDLVAVITVTMVGITLIMLAGINLAILTSKYKKYELLFPVFSNGVHNGFFISIIKILGLYGCISISLPYLARIRETKEMIKHSVIGLLIVIQMEIVAIIGVISTFNVDFASSMPYPKLIQTQQVSYSRFLEFGELYVMLQILGGWMLKYTIAFYAILILCKEIFKFQKKQLVYTTYIVSVFVYIGSYFLANELATLFAFFNIYSYICFASFVVIPFIIFTIFAVKMNKEKAEAEI